MKDLLKPHLLSKAIPDSLQLAGGGAQLCHADLAEFLHSVLYLSVCISHFTRSIPRAGTRSCFLCIFEAQHNACLAVGT